MCCVSAANYCSLKRGREKLVGLQYQSWGRFPIADQHVAALESRAATLPHSGNSVLAYGRGRSYGDCCLNNGATVLSTERLDNFISFNRESGIIRCEAGVGFDDLLATIVPAGWFLPVTPGTQYITVGGAIANDIHGKNHHRSGTFGRFVRAFEIVRSNGDRLLCSPTTHPDLYQATIGGMGLTGLITWAEIQLTRIETAMIDMESIKFGSLDEFFQISANSDTRYEYTVAWLDCVSCADKFGRGIFMGGNPLSLEAARGIKITQCKDDRVQPPLLSIPFNFPSWALNTFSVKAFNELYYGKQFKKEVRKPVHYRPFFYPLDAVNNWNRIYGKGGFVQFQCVVPKQGQKEVMSALLEAIVKSGQASFLAVLKEFGSIQSPGTMSFPKEGATLALDFAHRGETTTSLLRTLEALTDEAGGRLYSAKDALMKGETFRKHYPQWQTFSKHIDPKFSSSFWRRVTQD